MFYIFIFTVYICVHNPWHLIFFFLITKDLDFFFIINNCRWFFSLWFYFILLCMCVCVCFLIQKEWSFFMICWCGFFLKLSITIDQLTITTLEIFFSTRHAILLIINQSTNRKKCSCSELMVMSKQRLYLATCIYYEASWNQRFLILFFIFFFTTKKKMISQ